MNIDEAGHLGHALLQLFGEQLVFGSIPALDLNVDLRRDAEVEDLGHHVRRLEVEQDLWKILMQLGADLLDVGAGRRVTFLERNEDLPVVDTDRRAVGEGKVIGPRRQADIVENQFEIARRDDAGDLFLNVVENLFRHLDPCARGRANVQLDQAGIDLRKEIRPDIHEQGAGTGEDGEDDDSDNDVTAQHAVEEHGIGLAEAIEALVE